MPIKMVLVMLNLLARYPLIINANSKKIVQKDLVFLTGRGPVMAVLHENGLLIVN